MPHYYDKDGNPRHDEAPGGKPTTLRQVRAAAERGDPWFPSVTTVEGVISAPGLERWKRKKVALAAGHHILGEALLSADPERYLGELEIDDAWARARDADAHAEVQRTATEPGIKIHGVLESAAHGLEVATGWLPLVNAVDDLLLEHTGFELTEFVAEQSFCNADLGFGGKVDLHNGDWVIDIKTKASVNDKTRGHGREAEQLAAYRVGLDVPEARLANVFVAREPDEAGEWAVKFCEHDSGDLAWMLFETALWRWQLDRRYGPLFERWRRRTQGEMS